MSSLPLWHNVVVVLRAVAEIAGLALFGREGSRFPPACSR